MVALFVLIGCGSDQSEFDEQSDIAYQAGCETGQVDGAVAAGTDGTQCRERSLVPMDAAEKGMVEYCGGKVDDDQPCYWWKLGYVACWLARYDMIYPIEWDAADCGLPDSGS
jgi:hypothetical protein